MLISQNLKKDTKVKKPKEMYFSYYKIGKKYYQMLQYMVCPQ